MTTYSDKFSIGDRRSLITLTSDMTFGGTSSLNPNILLNGNTTEDILNFTAISVVNKHLTFKFNTKTIISEVKLYTSATTALGTWKWQGSNDGLIFTDIGASFILSGTTSGNLLTTMSANTNYYKYYRLLGVSGTTSVTPYLREFEFKASSVYDKSFILSSDGYKKFIKGSPATTSDVNAIPIMTSNTLPNGIASASTTRAGNDAWRAFNGVVEAGGWHVADGLKVGWLRYDFISKIIITRYSIANYIGYPTSAPKDWTFEGSNDGFVSDINILDTQSNQTGWVDSVWKEYSFNNSVSYSAYRINATTNNGYTSLAISEMKMFEASKLAVPPLFKTVASTLPTLTQFQTEGMDDLSIFDRKVQTVLESPIDMTSEVLGVGKVLKATVNLNKYFDLRKLEVK